MRPLWYLLFIFSFGMKGVPYVPQRLAERPKCLQVNNYVDEMSERMLSKRASSATPPRPFKPKHLRSAPMVALPDPTKCAGFFKRSESEASARSKPCVDYCSLKQPTIPTKPSHYSVRCVSNRDEHLVAQMRPPRRPRRPSSASSTNPPPTLDEMINRTRERKENPVVFFQPRGSALRPGLHGFFCPRCRRCTCAHCCETSSFLCCNVNVADQQLLRQRCDEVFDVLSCYCAIRACSYHFGYDEHDQFRRVMSDKPASCRPVGAHCALRWSILSALTVVLPCLVLYPMFKTGEALSQKASRKLLKGCQCSHNCR